MKLPIKYLITKYVNFVLFIFFTALGVRSGEIGYFFWAALVVLSTFTFYLENLIICAQYLKSIDQTLKEQKELFERALNKKKDARQSEPMQSVKNPPVDQKVVFRPSTDKKQTKVSPVPIMPQSSRQ